LEGNILAPALLVCQSSCLFTIDLFFSAVVRRGIARVRVQGKNLREG
jgi:hypothetical protein